MKTEVLCTQRDCLYLPRCSRMTAAIFDALSDRLVHFPDTKRLIRNVCSCNYRHSLFRPGGLLISDCGH